MSGIAGIIRFDSEPIAPDLIELMTNTMHYRGPDGIRHRQDVNAAFGHCMLHTTPESLEEEQPLTDDSGTLVMVMAGRVDNWEELRTRVTAHRGALRNRSDAELVLCAYSLWGSEFVQYVEGDFAMAIWNRTTQCLHCVRDRVAAKPFHYHWNGRVFAFASDLNAILALPWVYTDPNEGHLAEMLAHEWLTNDETFWTGVNRLAPAHRMNVTAQGLEIERYWELNLETKLRYKHDEEYVDCYQELFSDAVRRASRSQHAVAYTVSGGLDSSAIYGVANHLLRAGTLPSPAVRAYVTAFYDDPGASEVQFWRDVGDFSQTSICGVLPSQMSNDWYRGWIAEFRDMPDFPTGSMHLSLEQRMRQDGCRVQIGGIGGDEWLTGSQYYYYEAIRERQMRQIYNSFSIDIKDYGLSRAFHLGLRFGLFPALPSTFQEKLRAVRRTQPKKRTEWLSPEMQNRLNQRRLEFGSNTSIERIEKTRHQELFYSKRQHLVHEIQERRNAKLGLEVRQPFYDTRLIQFAISIPERLLRQGSEIKIIHRKAMKGVLPDSVLQRRTKAEFSTVFRNQLNGMEEEFVRQIPSRRAQWLEPNMVETLYRKFQSGSRKDSVVDATSDQLILWNIFICDAIYDGIY